MRQSEAAQIVGILNSAFPREAVEAETSDFWVRSLEPFNASVASEAALLIGQRGQHFPTFAEFRTTYQQRARMAQEAVPALPEPERDSEVPEWISVWWWDRHVTPKDEWRLFPQQPPDPRAMSDEEYEAKRAEWIEAGAPQVRDIREIAGALAGQGR